MVRLLLFSFSFLFPPSILDNTARTHWTFIGALHGFLDGLFHGGCRLPSPLVLSGRLVLSTCISCQGKKTPRSTRQCRSIDTHTQHNTTQLVTRQMPFNSNPAASQRPRCFACPTWFCWQWLLNIRVQSVCLWRCLFSLTVFSFFL